MGKREEKLTLSLIFLLFCTVLLAQLFLLRPDTRPIFTDADLFEGTPGLNTAEKTGFLTLETKREEPGVFVLINGIKTQSFLNKQITIWVQEHSLIEVETVGVNHAVTVEITGFSDFINSHPLNKKVTGKDDIFFIGRILFQ